MARCRGASSIIITDISASRLFVAKGMGADHIMLVGKEGEGSEEELACKISSLIGGHQVDATIGMDRSLKCYSSFF
jgi:threonine dehydrogenase-like Zn-dependent dehydrogenase